MKETLQAEFNLSTTRTAFLWTRLLNVPFLVLLNILPIILYKDLNISPWLVTTMIVIKPASALFASYWSSWIHERQDRLISNIILANIIRYIPFLFIPWISSPLIIIASFGLYMTLSRGVMPAWMEVFKQNLNHTHRSQLFSYGSALDYFITALFPIVLGLILDDYVLSWRFLFPISAALGLISTLFILNLPESTINSHSKMEKFCIKKHIAKPWKESLKILQESKGFYHYQIGFFLGGAGLMLMQSVIPIFFVDTLNLSYTKMLLALGVFKAIGYAFASPLAVRLFHEWNIYKFSGFVSLAFALFPLLLMAAEINTSFVYFAYLLYGSAQTGSELSWHLSGPLFSHDKDSAPYSTTNILLVGVRGCLAPIFGSLLFYLSGSSFVLLLGASLCTLSAKHLITYQSKMSRSCYLLYNKINDTLL